MRRLAVLFFVVAERAFNVSLASGARVAVCFSSPGRDFFRCCCWERMLARRVVTLFVFVVGREGGREGKGEEDGRQANSR